MFSSRKLYTRRKGFTIVELLVVISIVGLVVALLGPAVEQTREVARQKKCADNLRQIGVAVQSYVSHSGQFPAAYMRVPKSHGWTSFTLPYLPGGEAIHPQYDFSVHWCDSANAQAIQTHIPVFECPAAGGKRVSQGTIERCEEPYTGAVLDYLACNRVSPAVVSRGWLPESTNVKGMFSRDEWCRPSDVTDGLSNTLLIAEAAGVPSLYVFRDKQPHPMYGNRGFGAWADGAPYFQAHGHQPDGRNWPGPCTINCTNDDAVYSFHNGGAQFLFADGQVRFLSEQLDLFVLLAIFTRANGEVISSYDY
ncbi:DUF1559 domain-containing protein [Symmachiella dynata]|uniref:DUF1559 domain-containing protein n=1 Tax=Symmachiella dynata TaxID=2527995 RepID=UPI0030ED70A1